MAVWERSDNTITWRLIHVLEKFEKGIEAMDAENLETLLAEAVKQYTQASPADRPAIAEAAAGAIDALLSALDGQASHEGVRQLAVLLIVERAKAEGRSAPNLQT